MLRRLGRLGITRGLLGGDRRWLVVGTVALGLRTLGKLVSKEPKVVYSEKLDPGESLVITHLTHHA